MAKQQMYVDYSANGRTGSVRITADPDDSQDVLRAAKRKAEETNPGMETGNFSVVHAVPVAEVRA